MKQRKCLRVKAGNNRGETIIEVVASIALFTIATLFLVSSLSFALNMVRKANAEYLAMHEEIQAINDGSLENKTPMEPDIRLKIDIEAGDSSLVNGHESLLESADAYQTEHGIVILKP